MVKLRAPRAEDRVIAVPDLNLEYKWISSRRLGFNLGLLKTGFISLKR